MVRNNVITRILFAFLLLLFTKPAFSGLSVKAYEELKKTDEGILKVYIYGVGDGYQWSNAMLRTRGDKRFYCSPENLALNAENFIDIIDSRIAKMKKAGENLEKNYVENILLFGLIESFPCPK